MFACSIEVVYRHWSCILVVCRYWLAVQRVHGGIGHEGLHGKIAVALCIGAGIEY